MKASSHANSKKGSYAEHLALEYLVSQGWKILDRNPHFLGGELDLVVRDPNGVLVFVEVKSSWSRAGGRAMAQIHARKQRLLWKAAQNWLFQRNIPDQCMRFDCLCYTFAPGGGYVREYVENAFAGPSSTW